jgi:superfamily II DNA or RNA helicase
VSDPIWDACPWQPRRWQREALPLAVEAVRARKRVVISAIMGAGKSVAIGALVGLAADKPGARPVVVGVPTQALVRQIAATLEQRLPGKVGQWYADRKRIGAVTVACYDSLPGLALELLARGTPCGLLVCDEVHQTQADSVRQAVALLAPTGAIGFTATPFRSDERERLELWDEVAYTYTLADALTDGVLVPWRTVNYDGSGEDDTDHVVSEMILGHARGPGIVSALSIEDAEAYAGILRDRGHKAEAIHSAMPRAARDLRVEWLRSCPPGETRCLVHVALLSEGVDFPWLRWLGLRRPVEARVRFVQELGRVLRSHPGKAEALVLDPHDLLGYHGIAHAPAVGACTETLDAREPREALTPIEREPPHLRPAVAVDAATRWARSLLLSLQAAGLAAPLRPSGWRTNAPSEKQIETLQRTYRRAARLVPEAHRPALRVLARPEIARGLQRGAVSDLIGTLFAVLDRGAWPADVLSADPLPPSYLDHLPHVLAPAPTTWAPWSPA